MLLEEAPIALDATGDHRFAGLYKDWATLLVVGFQQRLAAPALEYGGQLPAQIGNILQAGVQSKATIWRVAVACVAGNEHSPDPIPLGNLDAQVPEADVIKLGAKLESSCLLEEAQEIVLLALCVARHRRMEK